MLDHLQEEQANQSAQLSQAPSVQEILDNDSVVSLTDAVDMTTRTPSSQRSASLTPLHEERSILPSFEVVEPVSDEWDWSLQHPQLAPFPDVGALVGTPEMVQSNALVVEHPHQTSRFGIRMVSLERSGHVVSGRIHDGTW